MLIIKPKDSRAFSQHFGEDLTASEVKQQSQQKNKAISILDGLAAKQAKVVKSNPFNNYESNLTLKIIDQRRQDLYQIVAQNPKITIKYVENAIEPVRDDIK